MLKKSSFDFNTFKNLFEITSLVYFCVIPNFSKLTTKVQLCAYLYPCYINRIPTTLVLFAILYSSGYTLYLLLRSIQSITVICRYVTYNRSCNRCANFKRHSKYFASTRQNSHSILTKVMCLYSLTT